MNTMEMMDLLALRLEDAGKGDFTDSLKLKALNNAQIKAANQLHNNYLTELAVLDSNKTVTTGVLAISSVLSYGVLRGGMGIRAVKVTGGLYCTMIDVMDIKKTENTFLQGNSNNPLAYVFQNRIYVLPASVTAVDVYYYRMPAPLYAQYTATGGTQSTILTTDTQLTTDSATLSQVADTYNGAVIYNVTDNTYFKVKDYAYSNPTYTFTVDDPGAGTAGQNAEKFYILTNGFDTLNLDNVTCQLNESLHDLVVTLAEAECWAMMRQLDRRNAALETAFSEIKMLNERYETEKAAGIGTDRKGR